MTAHQRTDWIVPVTPPFEGDWSYNGDFWEVGYHDGPEGDGEWVVLASLYNQSMDHEAEATWKLLHETGTSMAAVPRMLAALRMVDALMDADPDAFSFDERVTVKSAIHAATHADAWTREG